MHDGRSERKPYGYTQGMEEFFILQYVPDKRGRFLDIGAYDGVKFSATRALVDAGWGGVYVEPDPVVLTKLHENTKFFPNTEILPVAIGKQSGKMTFYSCGGDMVGTLDKEHTKKWRTTQFFMTEADVLSVPDLAARVGTDFDFINIDVEGINWDIFCDFDWNVWKPKVVCVEYDDHYEDIMKRLRSAGYSPCYASPENIVAYRTG
jgi:FkbM family methyltransferase